MTIANKFIDSTFILTKEDVAGGVKGVESFNYPGRLLHWSDDDWPVFIKKSWKARQVWERLEKFLQQEGAEPIVSAKFCHVVVQAVSLFVAETWVLTASMA